MTDAVKQIDDGGAAFPVAMSEQTSTNQYCAPFQEGMTIRDWFAGQALNGICAGLCSDHRESPEAYSRVDFTAAIKDSFKLADLMIAARKAGA